MFMTDTRIIQHHAGLDVHAQRYEVMFKDGSAIGMHPVSALGVPQLYLRATQQEGLWWLVVDLHHLCPALEGEAKRLPGRDMVGLVFYSLRQEFPTANAFTTALERHRLARWFRHETQALAA
jgi:hypothetical protein